MSRPGRRLWTTSRQVIGNLLPLIAVLIPAIPISLGVVRNGVTWPAIGQLLGCIAFGVLVLNYLGLYGNRGMQRKFSLRYPALYPDAPAPTLFVGFARPDHKSLLDPHEDIGFLTLTDDSVAFRGEIHEVDIPKHCIESIRLRPNIHSWLWLGGWVSFEAKIADKTIRLDIEPRKYHTLFANARFRRRFVKEAQAWLKTSHSATDSQTENSPE